MKSGGGKSQRREEKKEDQRRERVRRKKMQARKKVEKWRITVLFRWFVASEGRKVGSLRRRVRSHLARWGMNNFTPLWREAHVEVKMYKARQLRSTSRNWDVEKVHAIAARSTFGTQSAHHVRSTFGSCDVQKVHAGVVRNTFRSQHVQNTSASEHFWKLRCWKSVRCCRAKHISKSKVFKIDGLGPRSDLQISCCMAGARDCAPCQKWAKCDGFVAFSTTTTTTLHSTPLHYIATLNGMRPWTCWPDFNFCRDSRSPKFGMPRPSPPTRSKLGAPRCSKPHTTGGPKMGLGKNHGNVHGENGWKWDVFPSLTHTWSSSWNNGMIWNDGMPAPNFEPTLSTHSCCRAVGWPEHFEKELGPRCPKFLDPCHAECGPWDAMGQNDVLNIVKTC